VKNLKEAWVFRTGDLKMPNDPGELTNEVTPIKVGNCSTCVPRTSVCSRLMRPPVKRNGTSIHSSTPTRHSSM
jgi:hypothetical protein